MFSQMARDIRNLASGNAARHAVQCSFDSDGFCQMTCSLIPTTIGQSSNTKHPSLKAQIHIRTFRDTRRLSPPVSPSSRS